uniref:proline dehydrogenase family protein n=1 Tax=Nocardioides marmoribigeumensis TaxID=433649 RepID=UPI0035B50B22
MLRRTLLGLARDARFKDALTTLPPTRAVVARFVPGESTREAVDVVAGLVAGGRLVSLDVLGEDTTDEALAERAVAAYVDLLEQLAARGLSTSAEVSVKLSAIGQALPDGERIARDHARRICRAARNAGTTVTLDMEDHTTTDSTLRVLRELRKDFPETGAVLQAYLRRTEADCRALAVEGSRVRLCKGAYDEPERVAFQGRLEVDRSYVRCLRVLMEGDGYPMVATHDPRLVAIAEALVRRTARPADSYEFQMLYGIRPDEQHRLTGEGHRVRVYVPYGQEWYGYLMRRLAERPANLGFFLRALASKK